jgi:hypothetical protein
MSSDANVPIDGDAPPPLPLPQQADNMSAEEDIEATNSTEYYYINRGSCLKILVAMCYGICNDDGSPILSLESEPWKGIHVLDIKPNNDGYAKEVIRCWERVKLGSDCTKALRPKQWTLEKIHEWLEQHPIVNEIDIAFLKATVAT